MNSKLFNHMIIKSMIVFSFVFNSYGQNSIDISKIITSENPNVLIKHSSQFNTQKSKKMGIDVITYQYTGDNFSLLDMPIKSIVFLVFEKNSDNIEYLEVKLFPSRENEKKLLEHFQKNIGDYILGDTTTHDSKEYIFNTDKGTYGFQYFPIETGIEELEMAYISKLVVKIENEFRKKQNTPVQEALPANSLEKQ